ncbi:MAG: prepilin-type N-terminal cleavage/methylation domain-containing protein [Sulfuritalea sp.]|jgi:type IV pilus assembly protein PilE|nr:prepilin-type N-terminal cleavage/methylation domain-containing protein [Sulfuritalea sp.]
MKTKTQKGFSLIELMIVVAIIGVLAAIAMPNYNQYVTRSRITEGVAGLSDARVRMEQYFQDNRFYNTDGTAATTCAASVVVPATANFTYSCLASANGQAYVWTATGIGSMTGFSYTINQVNARTSAIVAGAAWPVAAANCWMTKQGGGC